MTDQRSARDELAIFFQGLGLTDRPDDFGDGIHGWRCEHPDRYGRCDCFEQAITDLLASPAIRRIQADAWAEGAAAGFSNGTRGDAAHRDHLNPYQKGAADD